MSSNRYKQTKELVDTSKTYSPKEAVALAKKTATANFDEAIEVHVKLGIDPSKSDQQIRGTVSLPHGTGKTQRVAAFVEPEKESEAKDAGADLIGNEELIEEIEKSGNIEFDVAVATPSMMPKVAKIARILGPRGLMPSPKEETVGPNIEKMIKEQKSGKQSFRNDKTGNLHQMIGRASFEEEKLLENLQTFLKTVRKMKPPASKGFLLRKVTICSSMGPGIEIDASVFRK